jgi:branched-chain amino acid transport system substrate-binding protein
MSISRRKFVAGIAAAGTCYTLASSLAAPAPVKGPAPVKKPALLKGTPVRIGILTPKNGAAATIGECGLRGVQWAVERVNKAGGIAGRRVELVIGEEASPKDTIENFRRLVQQKVDCVQGLVSTGTSLAVAPVAEEAKSLLILWDGTTQNGVKDTMPEAKYVFKSTDNECEAVMGSLLAVKYYKGKFKTIAGMNPDYSYGHNNWQAFKQILTRYGVEFEVVAEQWPKVGSSANDLVPHVDALKSAKPDLIFSSMLFADLPLFMSQAHATGLLDNAKFVLPAGTWQINALKKEFVPEGTILGWNTLYFGHPKASKLQKEFVADYFKRYKEAPHWEADRAYFAFAAYKAGVEAAYKKTHRWPTKDEVIASIPGRNIVGLGGVGRFREDKIAEQVFYQGLSTNKNKYPFPTLSTFESFPASQLQKPSGDDFWDWIKTAPMPI